MVTNAVLDFEVDQILAVKDSVSTEYIVLEADPSYEAPDMEFREIFGKCLVPPDCSSMRRAFVFKGVVFSQARNKVRDLCVLVCF